MTVYTNVPRFIWASPSLPLVAQTAETERPPVDAGALATVMTVPDLAKRLGVSAQTVYGMIRRREVPGAHRVGRLLRIDRTTVERWITTTDSTKGKRR